MNARVKNLISQNTQKPMISDQFIEIMEMPDEKFDIMCNILLERAIETTAGLLISYYNMFLENRI